MAVSGGAIAFSSTAMAVGSLACPRSTPMEYRLGEYFGILGGWYPVSHVITIGRLLSLLLQRLRRRRERPLCRRKRRESLRCPATHKRTPGERTHLAWRSEILRGLRDGCVQLHPNAP